MGKYSKKCLLCFQSNRVSLCQLWIFSAEGPVSSALNNNNNNEILLKCEPLAYTRAQHAVQENKKTALRLGQYKFKKQNKN